MYIFQILKSHKIIDTGKQAEEIRACPYKLETYTDKPAFPQQSYRILFRQLQDIVLTCISLLAIMIPMSPIISLFQEVLLGTS